MIPKSPGARISSTTMRLVPQIHIESNMFPIIRNPFELQEYAAFVEKP
jgi:hypothetical protein